MESLQNLIGNIPNWSIRLEEFSTQIDRRQLELAKSAESARPKSIRNRGSTESLKPLDDDAGVVSESAGLEPSSRQHNGDKSAVRDPSSAAPRQELSTRMESQQQTLQAMAVAQAKARATVKKRHRTDSVISAEGAAPKYRTRSMIIVYYDSYVQSFFEELVKFVSASRNMMRKAKMAAKVAQIKRMAELDMPDLSDDEEGNIEQKQNGTPSDVSAPLEASTDIETNDQALPVLRFTSTNQMRHTSRSAGMLSNSRPAFARSGYGSYSLGRLQPPDIYDELDKGLDYVQSMCEHAAHQFLRDGDCNEELDNIKRKMTETKLLADKEMERVLKEDPDALKPSEEPPKSRSFRPQSMRRGKVVPDHKPDEPPSLEIDEGIDDMDGEPLKLVYNSTRMMR